MAAAPVGQGDATVYEETHVHDVYEAIAPHFSVTRHKPWPFVSSFVASQPPGSVGLDVGCGNGKNMGVNRDVIMLGCDRSAALVGLARDMWCSRRIQVSEGEPVIAGADVAVADSLDLPFRDGSADFVICIAVIHHMSTRERRVDAIRQLLRCIRREEPPSTSTTKDQEEAPGGQVLVYVWALEQSTSRRGWDEGGEQDLLVPWVMKAPQQKKPKAPKQPRKKKQQQQQQQDQQGGSDAAAPDPVNGDSEAHDPSGGEGMQGRRQESRGNHDSSSTGGGAGAAVEQQRARREEEEEEEEEASRRRREEMPAKEKAGGDGGGDRERADAGAAGAAGAGGNGQPHTDKTFHRFYHLYRKGELEEDVVAAGGEVLRSGYERDNWWVIAG